MKVKLTTIQDVQEFVHKANQEYPNNLYAKQSRYLVDAKSIMGLFSLDLMHPFELLEENITEGSVCDNKAKIFVKFINVNDLGDLSYNISWKIADNNVPYVTLTSLDCDGVIGGGSTVIEAEKELRDNLKAMIEFLKLEDK